MRARGAGSMMSKADNELLTGEFSFAGPGIDYASIRAVSYAFPRHVEAAE